MAGPINIRLGAIVTDFVAGFRTSERSTVQLATALNGQLSQSFTSTYRRSRQFEQGIYQLGGGLKNIISLQSAAASALGGLFAVDTIIGFGSQIVKTTGQTEKFGSVLRNALQSGSGSRETLRGLSDFAAETPNQLEELTGSFIKFVNRGLVPTRQQLTNFGDLAASQGKGFDQLTEAILDAQSGEFERLKEFGIRASKSGDQVTLAFKGVTQTVALTNEGVTSAIEKFGQLTGVAGSMSAVAQTQEGQVSNLSDSYDRLLVALGEGGVGGSFKAAVASASSFLNVVTNLIANSPAEDLRKQQTEINNLVGAIALANDNESVRLSLIQKLRQEYPEFLGRLNDEAASNSVLASRLADVNRQYEQKIRIALGQEKIKKSTEDLTKAIDDQGKALRVLAQASGKSITDLEKLDAAGRIALAKDLAQKSRAGFQLNTGYIAPTQMDYVAQALERGAAVQKKAQAELDELTKENTVRQAELTKTTVAGYQAQIAQIQQKIKLRQIDAKLGAEEIKRLNDQIRVAEGKALTPPKPQSVVGVGAKGAALSASALSTNERILKRITQELENMGDKASPKLREMVALFQELVKQEKELSNFKPVDLGEKAKALSVNGSFTDAFSSLTNQVNGTTAAPKLPYLEQLKQQIDFVQQGLDEKKQQFISYLGVAKGQLAEAGVGLFENFGAAIGNGGNPLRSILQTVVNFIGDFAIKLGSAILLMGKLETVAAAIPGLAPLFALTGPAKIIVGAGLVAGGAAIKAIGNFAGGGLITGEKIIRVGENSRALAGGGEFVAPVALGANLISERIMKNIGLMSPRVNTPDMRQVRQQRVLVSHQGEFRLHKGDLVLSLADANNTSTYLS